MSFTVVPKLTEDATLKRARTDLTPNTSALTITGVTTPDLTPITDATGTPTDPAWTSGDGTVVGLLKGIYTKLTPPKVTVTTLENYNGDTASYVSTFDPSQTYTVPNGWVWMFFSEDSTNYYFYILAKNNLSYALSKINFPAGVIYRIPLIASSFPFPVGMYSNYEFILKDASGNAILHLTDVNGNDAMGEATVISKSLLTCDFSQYNP